jgi:hypothetical protein
MSIAQLERPADPADVAKPPFRAATLELPPERWRPWLDRVEALLANPRAANCAPKCPMCSSLPPELIRTVLDTWDHLARSGIWPVRTAVLRFLCENGLADFDGATRTIRSIIWHRREKRLFRRVDYERLRWGVIVFSTQGDDSG